MNTQPLYNQLELKFSGPLYKDLQTENLNSLLTLENNYRHKFVWVISEQCHFYLKDNCDGTQLEHWAKYGVNATIIAHQNIPYDANIAVHKDGNIYISKQEVPENIDVTNNAYWEKINGNVKLKEVFANSDEWIISNYVNNPSFEVYIDNELVDACIINNGNNTYSVRFIVNNEFVQKSGYVYIF